MRHTVSESDQSVKSANHTTHRDFRVQYTTDQDSTLGREKVVGKTFNILHHDRRKFTIITTILKGDRDRKRRLRNRIRLSPCPGAACAKLLRGESFSHTECQSSDLKIIASRTCIAGACTDVYARYLILPERHNGTVWAISPHSFSQLEITRYNTQASLS